MSIRSCLSRGVWGKGFTLVELLTVIAIIGILSTIVMVSLLTARQKGRDVKRVADIKQIQLALEQYYNENLSYPNGLSSLQPTFMPVVPKDPITGNDYIYVAANAIGTTNCTSNKGIMYHLGAVMEIQGTVGAGNYQQVPGRYNSWQANVCGATGNDFNGASVGCTTTYDVANQNKNAPVGTATTCYDVVNQ